MPGKTDLIKGMFRSVLRKFPGARETARRKREQELYRQRMAEDYKRLIEYGIKQALAFGESRFGFTLIRTREPQLNLRHHGWTADIIRYCEDLGLQVEVLIAGREMGTSDCWYLIQLWVGWNPDTPPSSVSH